MKNLKSPKTKEIKEETNEIEKLELLLSTCKDSYKDEEERKRSIDTKSLYMLLISIILVSLLIIKINLMDLDIGWRFLSGLGIAARIIFFVLCISQLVLCFISIIKYIRILNSKKYLKLDSKEITVEHFKDVPYESVLYSITKAYRTGAEKNSALNNKLTRKYFSGTILTLISMFLLIGIYIFSFFVI